jgi:hypothetical protein
VGWPFLFHSWVAHLQPILWGLDILARGAKVMLAIDYGYSQFDFFIDYCYGYWLWLLLLVLVFGYGFWLLSIFYGYR